MPLPISQAPPPEPERRTMYVVTPKVGEPVRAVSLARRPVGVWTHWLDGTTHPHLDAPHPCPGCKAKAPRRWKGYLHAWSYTHKRPCLLELPADAVRLTVQLRDDKVDLRGARINLRRVGPHPNSQVVCEVQLNVEKIGDGVEEIDVMGALAVRWGLRCYGPMEDPDAAELPAESDGRVPQ